MEFALQKTLYAPEVKNIRKNLNMKQKELAVLLNVSVKTVEHWESSGGSVSGAAAALLCILRERPSGRTGDPGKEVSAVPQISERGPAVYDHHRDREGMLQ